MLRVVLLFLQPQTKAPKKEGMADRGMASSSLCSCRSALSKLVGSRAALSYEARKRWPGQSCGQDLERSNARVNCAPKSMRARNRAMLWPRATSLMISATFWRRYIRAMSFHLCSIRFTPSPRSSANPYPPRLKNDFRCTCWQTYASSPRAEKHIRGQSP